MKQQQREQRAAQPAAQAWRIGGGDLKHRHDLIGDADHQHEYPAEQAEGGVGGDRGFDGRRRPPAGAQQGEAQSEQEGDPKACHREPHAADRDAGDGAREADCGGREKDHESPAEQDDADTESGRFGGQKAGHQGEGSACQRQVAEPGNLAGRRQGRARHHRQHLHQRTQHDHGEESQRQRVGERERRRRPARGQRFRRQHDQTCGSQQEQRGGEKKPQRQRERWGLFEGKAGLQAHGAAQPSLSGAAPASRIRMA